MQHEQPLQASLDRLSSRINAANRSTFKSAIVVDISRGANEDDWVTVRRAANEATDIVRTSFTPIKSDFDANESRHFFRAVSMWAYALRANSRLKNARSTSTKLQRLRVRWWQSITRFFTDKAFLHLDAA